MGDYDIVKVNEDQALLISTRDLLAAGFRHKRRILMCFFGILAGALLYALLMPTYQAETKILVKRERQDPVVSTDKENPSFRDLVTEEELNSEVELMRSDDVLRKVVAKCGLDQHSSLLSYLFGSGSQEKRTAKAVAALSKGLDIEPLKKSNIIQITYRSKDPRRAAAVLSAVDAFYMEKHLAVHRPAGQFQFFSQQADMYEQQLQAAEAKLKEFPEQNGANPDQARDFSLQKLSDFNANLEQTRADIASSQRRIRDLERQAANTPSRMTTQVRSADAAQLIEQLKTTLLTLELKRTELLAKFQPTYRPVQELEKQIADTRAQLQNEEARPLREETTDQNPTYGWINGELARARADLMGLEARETALKKVIADYQTHSRELDEASITKKDLVRSASTAETNYLLYVQKREESRISDALDRSRILNVAIAEAPVVPVLPVHSPLMIVLIGVLVALTMSAALLLAIEYLDQSFRTPLEVESVLSMPVLAAVPLNGHGNGANLPVLEGEDIGVSD